MALDRETVVRTALRVLDEVGIEGLTLRKIAAALDVQAPALYWHFKNKQELLDEMATTVFADNVREVGLPSSARTWPEWAMDYGKNLRQMLLRYRDGARMFSGTYLTDSALYAPMEQALQTFTAAGFALPKAIFTAAGFALPKAISGLSTIYFYAIGFTIEEQAIYPQPGQRNPQYDAAKRAERIDSTVLPLAQAAGAELFSDFDRRFEQGLQLIISGMREQNSPPKPAS
jgi:AcrR family transcriptional regulator